MKKKANILLVIKWKMSERNKRGKIKQVDNELTPGVAGYGVIINLTPLLKAEFQILKSCF